jgi:hypothetical protein
MISSLLTPHPVVRRIMCGSLLSEHRLISLLSKTNSLASTIFKSTPSKSVWLLWLVVWYQPKLRRVAPYEECQQ